MKDTEPIIYQQDIGTLLRQKEELRQIVLETRDDLYKTLERLNKKFNINEGKPKP